jgi:hypothetical protein
MQKNHGSGMGDHRIVIDRGVDSNPKMIIGGKKALFVCILLISLLIAAISFGPLSTNKLGSPNMGDDANPNNGANISGPSGTDHAVWGFATDIGGTPLPDGTPVNISVFHVDHYTVYATSGTSSGWYSYVLSGGEQGTNWDAGDDISVNVTYSAQPYVNQTTITSTSNQQIDVHCDVPIPEFSEIVVPIAGLMLIVLIFNRTRKKP